MKQGKLVDASTVLVREDKLPVIHRVSFSAGREGCVGGGGYCALIVLYRRMRQLGLGYESN